MPNNLTQEEEYKYIEENLQKFVDETLDVANKNLAKIRKEEVIKNYKGEDRVESWKEIYKSVQTRGLPIRIPLGYKSLDDAMDGGVSFGHLVSIVGPTKNGKTSLAIDITHNLQKYKPIWFSFEQNIEEIILKQVEFGRELPEAFAPISQPFRSLEWIEQKINEAYIKNGTKVVIIDHLQFVQADLKMNRYDLQLMEVVSKLKQIATRTQTVIFLMAHLKKVEITEMPTINDIKETSSVSQWSDKVLITWREAKKEGPVIKYTNRTFVSLAADRQSGKMETIEFEFNKGRFIDMGLPAFVDELKRKKQEI